jgi:hypothetical protein
MLLLRLGVVCLLIAMVVVVIDPIKNLAVLDGDWVFTSLGDQCSKLSPNTLAAAKAAVETYAAISCGTRSSPSCCGRRPGRRWAPLGSPCFGLDASAPRPSLKCDDSFSSVCPANPKLPSPPEERR